MLDIIRERTDSEKESFLEGFNCCISSLKGDLSKDKGLQEAIEHVEDIARLIGSSQP